MKITYLTKSGRKGKDLNFNPPVKNLSASGSILHQIFRTEQLKKIRTTAHTKTRSERRGGGRKPWRQKGTGRARAGSLRSPLFRKGGVIFGPRREKKLKRKLLPRMKKIAILAALTDRAKKGRFIVFEEIPKDLKKTKDAEIWLAKTPIKEGRIILIYLKGNPDPFKNLYYLKLCRGNNFSFSDLIVSDYILMEREIFENIKNKLKDVKVKKKKVKS